MNDSIILAIPAVILLAISSTQFATAGFVAARGYVGSKRRRLADLWSLRQAAEIARLNSELQSATSKQTGLGWRVMEVAELVDESDDCRSIYLVDPYGQSLPDFRPGQYLMVRPALAGAYQTTRCYSLSSSPNSRYWRITVKRQESDQHENGPVRNGGLSKWIHRTIGKGDCLLIGGPSGQFYLPAESTSPLVLLAAGVGITPMASMLRWSLEKTPERPVVLIYQAKNLSSWPLGQSLHAWQENFPNCKVISYFSREEESELEIIASQLPGGFNQGKFNESDALSSLPGPDSEFYMCGPDGWMQAIRNGLIEAGIEANRVHWESFGGAGAQPTAVTTGEAVDALPVRFDHSDVDVQWNDREQTLWELARESQVDIPSGCLSGVCGCCRVKLISGEVEYDRTVSIELAADECLTCVSRPKTAVVIDA